MKIYPRETRLKMEADQKLREAGEQEYIMLVSDMVSRGDNWSYKGGFEAWYKEVFLIDEAWQDIRELALEEN